MSDIFVQRVRRINSRSKHLRDRWPVIIGPFEDEKDAGKWIKLDASLNGKEYNYKTTNAVYTKS